MLSGRHPSARRGDLRHRRRQASRNARDGRPLHSFARSRGAMPTTLANIEEEDSVLELVASLSIDDFPALPLVDTTDIQYGKPANVDLQVDYYIPPRPISLISFLAEPPPQPPAKRTLKKKTIRKTRQTLALLRNPRADSNFPYLPTGLNLKLDPKKDPLKDKVHRLLNPKKPKGSNAVVVLSADPVPAPDLKSRQGISPVSPRHVPKVKPSKKIQSENTAESLENPFVVGQEVLWDSPEERARKVKLVTLEQEWRKASDLLIAQRGRQHFSSPKIGRAPPLSRRQIFASNFSTLRREGARISLSLESKPRPQQPPIASAYTSIPQDLRWNRRTYKSPFQQHPTTGRRFGQPTQTEEHTAPQLSEATTNDSQQATAPALLSSVPPDVTNGINIKVPFLPAPRAFDFATNSNIFVGFARLPDSCFVPILNATTGGRRAPPAETTHPAQSSHAGLGTYSSLIRELAASASASASRDIVAPIDHDIGRQLNQERILRDFPDQENFEFTDSGPQSDPLSDEDEPEPIIQDDEEARTPNNSSEHSGNLEPSNHPRVLQEYPGHTPALAPKTSQDWADYYSNFAGNPHIDTPPRFSPSAAGLYSTPFGSAPTPSPLRRPLHTRNYAPGYLHGTRNSSLSDPSEFEKTTRSPSRPQEYDYSNLTPLLQRDPEDSLPKLSKRNDSSSPEVERTPRRNSQSRSSILRLTSNGYDDDKDLTPLLSTNSPYLEPEQTSRQYLQPPAPHSSLISNENDELPVVDTPLKSSPDLDTFPDFVSATASSLPPRARSYNYNESRHSESLEDDLPPWPTSPDPFNNPPPQRKESWTKSAKSLSGEDYQEEEELLDPTGSPELELALLTYGREELEETRKRYRGSQSTTSRTGSVSDTPQYSNLGSFDSLQRSERRYCGSPIVKSPDLIQDPRRVRERPAAFDLCHPQASRISRQPLDSEHSPSSIQNFSFPSHPAGGLGLNVEAGENRSQQNHHHPDPLWSSDPPHLPESEPLLLPQLPWIHKETRSSDNSKGVGFESGSLRKTLGVPSPRALASFKSLSCKTSGEIEEFASSPSSISTSPTHLPKQPLRRKKTLVGGLRGFVENILPPKKKKEHDEQQETGLRLKSSRPLFRNFNTSSESSFASSNLQKFISATAEDRYIPGIDGNDDSPTHLSPFDYFPPEPTRPPPPVPDLTSPPPIPRKLRPRLNLIRKDNIDQQSQDLTEVGSRFKPSPEKYPSIIDALPSPLGPLKLQDRRKRLSAHQRVDSVSLPAPPLIGVAYSGSPRSPALLGSPRFPAGTPRSSGLSGSPRSAEQYSYSPTRSSRASNPSRLSNPFSFVSAPQTLFTPVTAVASGFDLNTEGLRDSFTFPVLQASQSVMDNQLQVRSSDFGSSKTKAIEDAKAMQASVLDNAKKSGTNPPKYVLLELIGKGSFGRVYKSKDMTSADIVAVKIIDIDESDNANPRYADTLSDFMKEINALKLLRAKNAKNINNVVDAFPVGHSMWMITEYCGGGSVATLMKPTAPGGLQEKWIITILREVVEAITWVHEVGIVHRDIKCANVLITEDGGLQLCDFGVAGVVETKFDKRSTVVGTPHWMAPELFGPSPKYGTEVDIWALGSMVYEMATGLPPNAANGITAALLPSHLQNYIPRLVGDQYSEALQDFVAVCLEELPSARATIEDCKNHPYIFNTSVAYPASALVALVRAFKLWEDRGGSRRSLFMAGGAQRPTPQSEYSPFEEDEWNFSTTAAFDQQVSRNSTHQDIYDAYGTGVLDFTEETSRPPPQQKQSRRRPPPEALAPLPVPLQKIFDSNTLSNYNENSRQLYGRNMQPPAEPPSRPISDLPLRDDTAHTSIRDTMIDLGGHDIETGVSSFPDDTIRADRRATRDEDEDVYGSLPDFSKPALSDPADMNPNRRTQDWKFPSMIPASADPETSRFPVTYDAPPRPAVTPASGGRPALIHHPTEPIGQHVTMSANDRMSLIDLDDASVRMSLINLDDASVPSSLPELTRPSTANSDVGSAASEYTSSGNPFELERHASMYQPVSGERDNMASRSTSKNTMYEGNNYLSDFSTSDADTASRNGNGYNSDSDYLSMPPPRRPQPPTSVPAASSAYGSSVPANPPQHLNLPPLHAPPSAAAMSGTASNEEMEVELNRAFAGMEGQLSGFRSNYDNFRNQSSSSSRRQGNPGE